MHWNSQMRPAPAWNGRWIWPPRKVFSRPSWMKAPRWHTCCWGLLPTVHQHAYVEKLLAAFPPVERPASTASPNQGGLIEALSERELEVLALIAQGLSNQAIADQLYISLHTVKVHARRIYAKLAVDNRTQAVVRGKSLGILPPD